jgi:predicted nucleotidyltransferase
MLLHIKDAVLEFDHTLSWIPNSLIYLVRHGSQAYGTATPASDLDIKGIVVPPARYFFGFLDRGFKQVDHTQPDYVLYDLRRYCELAAGCNPNLIEMLFVEPADRLVVHPAMQLILDSRHLFLSRLARDTFFGYAHNQLKRIKNHRAWLLNPPKKKPTRADFGLPEMGLVGHDQIMAAEHLYAKGFTYDTNFQALVEAEKRYRTAQAHWESYENWQKTRNPARHKLEADHGYDTKHAMHLVRLMRMCREILVDGTVQVMRSDAQELLAIRNGAWTYDELISWADENQAEIDQLCGKSPLPKLPDRQALDTLCQTVAMAVLAL